MSANDNLPPLPESDHLMESQGCEAADLVSLYTADQMREYAGMVALGSWQQGWNECSALREAQIAEAERDAAKYRALLVSAKGKPENLERLLPEGSHDHYIRQSVIDAFEADPNVQMAAHILVSERPGKFDLIHLVAYLMSSHWMPIDDAPKGHSLLLWTDHGPALGWWSVFDNQWTAGLWTALFPTHYMLIPPMLESKP